MSSLAHFSAAEVYDLAVETEQNGKAFYEAASKAAKTENVRKLMDYLADAEAQHERTFLEMRERSDDAPPPESYPGERREYMDSLLKARVLPDVQTGVDRVASMTDDAEALDFALAFEKDTILFMYEMMDVVPAAQKAVVLKLVDQERGHVNVLTGMKTGSAQ